MALVYNDDRHFHVTLKLQDKWLPFSVFVSYRSPGGTPLAGWPKKRCDSNVGFFNTKLVDKFKNIDSPVSPLVSSPGYFESESPVKSFANSSSSS